jgi:hypothetical protein
MSATHVRAAVRTALERGVTQDEIRAVLAEYAKKNDVDL